MRQTLKAGTDFHNRYRIIKPLGAGGSGDVYLATQLDVNRKVALKIVNISGEAKQKHLDRFLREFKLLSTLNHHNIVTFYSAAIADDGSTYAVCEYINGKSLHYALQEATKIPWPRLAKIILQVCDAMQYAHSNSVIHRDLKPDNIMLLDSPEPDTVKIIDFGLGKDLEDVAQKLTGTGMLMGTPHYMSPEQALGQGVDARADIYALGCIIFECLCGRKLFDAYSPLGILHKQASEDPGPILEVAFPTESAGLVRILEKMLEKDANARYQTMEAVRNDVEKLSNQDVHAVPIFAAASFDSPGEKKTNLLKYAAVVGILLSVLVAGVFVLKNSSSKSEKSAAAVTHYETTADNTNKRMAEVEEQFSRYEERLKGEKDPERRKSLIDMFFRRGKELRFEQKKASDRTRDENEKRDPKLLAAEEKTVLRMLKYIPEMDDASLLHADLVRSLAYFEMEKGDYRSALKYCDDGLKVLEGQHAEAREYVLRMIGAKAKALVKLKRLEEALELVKHYEDFVGIPSKDSANPVYSRFPYVPMSQKTAMASECVGMNDVLEMPDYPSDAEKYLAIQILATMADALIQDSDPKSAQILIDSATEYLAHVQDKQSAKYRDMDDALKKLAKLRKKARSKRKTIM